MKHGFFAPLVVYNLSVNRAKNYSRIVPHIRYLENEWGLYKYLVLERSPANYHKIKMLLMNKKNYPVESFCQLIDDSLNSDILLGNFINTACHVFGYFKQIASDLEKKKYIELLNTPEISELFMKEFKTFLFQLAIKYQKKYLIESLYFYL